MFIIQAVAYPNKLTSNVSNDFYVLPLSRGTLYEADIIKRLEAKQIATKNVYGPAYMKAFFEELLLAVFDGYTVVTPFFHAGLKLNGVVYSQDLGHNLPAGQVGVTVHLLQSVETHQEAMKASIHVMEQVAASGPVIQSIINPLVGEPDKLNVGQMVLIQGLRLAIRGDQTELIGVDFHAASGQMHIHVPPSQISPNTPSKLQFILPPDVTSGTWYVSASSQGMSKTTQYTKDVRTYTYPQIVTVE